MEKIFVCAVAIILCLALVLAVYWWQKKCAVLYDSDDVVYIMHAPRNYLFLGIADIVLFGLFCILSVVFMEEEMLLAFSCFYFFMFWGLYLCIYTRLWKGVIKTDSLVFYMPLCPVKEIKFYEITAVKYTERPTAGYGKTQKVLEGYKKRKKVFSIEETMGGFDLLCCFFEQSGKIEHAPIKENFSVTPEKRDVVLAVISLPFFTLLFAVMVWEREEVGLLYVIASGAVLLGCLPEILRALVCRINVDFYTISVRNRLGMVKTYKISQITEVAEQENHIVLYADGNKIARIPKDSENLEYLTERLRRREMTDYKTKAFL